MEEIIINKDNNIYVYKKQNYRLDDYKYNITDIVLKIIMIYIYTCISVYHKQNFQHLTQHNHSHIFILLQSLFNNNNNNLSVKQ